MFPQALFTDLSAKLQDIAGSTYFLLPEGILLAVCLGILIGDLLFPKLSFGVWARWAIAGIGLSMFLLVNQLTTFSDFTPTRIFIDFLIYDSWGLRLKIITDVSLLLTILITLHSGWYHRKEFQAEYLILLVVIGIGLHLLVMAAHFLMLYVALELVSIGSYLLTAFLFDKKSAEGSIKYLLYGSIASAVMLYGISWLYGFTGTLYFTESDFLLSLKQIPPTGLWLAFVFTFGGLLFKASAFPFHFWTPDVYESAPTPLVAFFSTAPKLMAVAVIARFQGIFGVVLPDWTLFLAVIAVFTISLGNLSALWQSNAKRLFAYSSIAHAGFLLIPIIYPNEWGQSAFLFYGVVYLFANFAVFFLIELMALQAPNEDAYHLAHFKGLGNAQPFVGIIALILLLALAGLPPTAGFLAKVFIFSSLWQSYVSSEQSVLLVMLVAGLLNTVIALGYYLKIPFYAFFRNTENDTAFHFTWQQKLILLLLVVPLLMLFFIPNWGLGFLQ